MASWRQTLLGVFRGNMLRTRLVLGLLCLLVILLAVGLYSLRQCSDLGNTISTILEDNYASLTAMEQIKLACSRLNAAAAMKVAGHDRESLVMYEDASQQLLDNIKVQQAQKHTPEEKAATDQLVYASENYLPKSRSFFALSTNSRLITGDRVRLLSAPLETLAQTSDSLQKMSLEALRAKKSNARTTIIETTRFLLLAMIVAVIVSLYASFRLGRGILQPIEVLTASIRAIGEGNLNQNVPVLFADELGELAHTVNQMAGQLRTYRTSTTEKILRLNRTMQTTFSSFPDPIFVMGPDGQIELKNPAANQLAARLAMEGIRRFPPFVEEKVQQVLETRQDYFTAKLRDAISFQLDQEHFYLLRVLLLEDEKGEVFGTAIVLEDVTKLRLLDDVKSGLVATVSHELKTPLTSVRMALHVLNESTVGPLNERQAELLTTAMDDSERLLRTLNNLLDLARLEETAAALELESVPAGDLLKTAVSQTRELALANQLKLETDFPPELPSLPVDRQRINHVFTNFITNAIKHSPPGTTVLVRARLEGQFVRVSVIDQGPGVPTEHRPYVFEKFYRVPGQAKSGAGLGLAIAKEIALAHQGHIGLKSEPGQNTEFFVDLPLQRKAEEES